MKNFNSFFAARSFKVLNIGSKNPATIPAENPLLYKFRPPWIVPIVVTTVRCSQPATIPQKIPKTPVIGARDVPNSPERTIVKELKLVPVKPASSLQLK